MNGLSSLAVKADREDCWEMRDPEMIEAGHDDRTLLDTLSPRQEEDIFDPEEAEPQRVAGPLLRIAAQGLIIGHILPTTRRSRGR